MMKSIVLFTTIFMLFACTDSRKQTEQNKASINLHASFEPGGSRASATAFTEGDQIGLYLLRKVDNALFTVGADGVIAASPALYYPDPKLPVAFRAYYPYNNSVTDATKIPFSVTTDLKQSDLCYAQAEALPSKEAQALPFKHWLSRVAVNITLNSKVKSIKSVKLLNTAIDLTFNIETGAIALGTQNRELAVNNSEAIVPPQTFAAGTKMLEITAETTAGATEVFHYTPSGATTLEQGKSYNFSFSLTDNKSVELTAAPLISPWTGGAGTGGVDQKVSNQLILHWAPAHSRASEINKIELTIKNNLTNVTSTMTVNNFVYNNLSFSFDISNVNNLNYPYTVVSIQFYKNTELIKQTSTILASSVYKSGTHAMGVKAPENAVYIDGLWWATGNLVADGATKCKIGAPTDYGLYFQFGSLIGWSGGANGDGAGKGYPALAIKVKPANCTKNNNAWVTTAPATNVSGYYFNYSVAPYNTSDGNTQFSSYPGVMEGSYSAAGIGDPCRYYLGSSWRLPTPAESFKLFGNVPGSSSWSVISGWSYNSSTRMAVHAATGLTLVGHALYRSSIDGGFGIVNSQTQFSLSGVYTSSSRYNMCIDSNGIALSGDHSREGGRTVRCVTE